jgi:hypothetical protein
MARVVGPLMSIDASGSIAHTMVFSKWKGRNYVRERIIPFNPKKEKQVNVRTALTLLVNYWKTQTAPQKLAWDNYAKGLELSGFNLFTSRGMKAYVLQLTTTVTPESVTVTGTVPAEEWTWTGVS